MAKNKKQLAAEAKAKEDLKIEEDAKEKEEAEAKAKTKEAEEKKESLRAAKETLQKFSVSALFGSLTDDVQAAILRVAPFKETRRKRTSTLLKSLFPEVGHVIEELDLFKETKMGRSEMKKKVRDGLAKAELADRLWISFNEDTEEWTLLAIGGTAPADYIKSNTVPKNIVEENA